MTVRYSSTWSRRARYTGQTTTHESQLSIISSGHPSGVAERAINWLSVVDEFKIKKHRNVFPRWSFLMIALAIMVI